MNNIHNAHYLLEGLALAFASFGIIKGNLIATAVAVIFLAVDLMIR